MRAMHVKHAPADVHFSNLKLFNFLDWLTKHEIYLAWNLFKQGIFQTISDKLTFLSVVSSKLSELEIWNKNRKLHKIWMKS